MQKFVAMGSLMVQRFVTMGSNNFAEVCDYAEL